jgi:para-nitrobenzyl esterase
VTTDLDAAPAVTLSHGGTVAGRSDGKVARFLGIPYAAAPFGANRLRAPQPLAPWSGLRDATSYGPTAPKGQYPQIVRHLLPEIEIRGEECLNVNVWAPAADAEPTTPYPVLVWIHGGSFLQGSNSLPEYDGAAFARHGVVCVGVNYRLGVEGFLELPDADTNRGLRDMIAALRWVRDEIAAFGGDPDRVTVAGESAGAMAIAPLLAAPSATGLFARAILHSGAASHVASAERAQRTAAQLGTTIGVPATRAALAEFDPGQLVAATAEMLGRARWIAAAGDLAPLALRQLPLAPVVDGDVLPQDPLTAAGHGAGADVPVLLCRTRDEARLFLVPGGALAGVDDRVLERAAPELYGLPADGLATYRAQRPGRSAADVLVDIYTDRLYLLPATALAEARAGAGATTWMARFDAVELEDNDGLGSCHASDLPFAFSTIDEPGVRARIGASPSRQAADALHGAWVSFARDGDPGWPAYEPVTRSTALFGEEVTVVDDPSGDERRAWPKR